MEEEVFAHGIKPGDKFTIAGCGYSARGHEIQWGRNIKTGRKMKVVRLMEFTAGPEVTATVAPAIIEG